MLRRLTALMVVMLHLGMITGPGLVHHHEDGDADHSHCLACHWQLSATADAPVITPLVVHQMSATTVVPPMILCLLRQFEPTTASRAPPEPLV